MSHQRISRHDHATPFAAESDVSSMRWWVGGFLLVGLLVSWGIGQAVAAGSFMDDAAGAAEPAHRLEVPPFVPAPATTTATTPTTPTTATTTTPTTTASPTTAIPQPPVEPPAEGEIAFPLALGAEGTAYVLENFGDTRGRCCGYYHRGVDIMADEGTPQIAVVDGELTYWHDSHTFGWTLTGDDGVVYKYYHSAEDANGWVVGDRVEQGDVIGFVSDSGTSAGNFHLHFEYRPNNVPADPYPKLQRVPGATFQV